MLLSYAIYFGLLILCGVCACLADRRDSKPLLWVIIAALTLVAGLRDYSVGLDTQGYVEMFSYIYRGMFRYAYGLEESFKYICYGILHIIPSASFLLGLLAFMTHAPILLRFWELRKISSLPCMVLFYYMSFYFISLNAVRQFVAVAIIFWGTRYLEQKKILPYVLCICAAALFHRTAVIGLLLLLLNLFQWRDMSRGQKRLYLLVGLCFPVIIILLVKEFEKYSRYLTEVSFDLGLIIPVKIALWLLCLFLMAHSAVYPRFLSGISSAERFELRVSSANYLLALLLAAMAYIFPTFIERISWYFYIYEGVFYGTMLRNTEKETKLPLAGIIFVLIAYGFWRSISHNSQGTMPFLFI